MLEHGTFDCKRGPFQKLGPKLCAAQEPNQSFLFIDELIDTKASNEKSNTAIITVLSGDLTAKQIQLEFWNTVSADLWKQNAKQIADKKFSLRFTHAKMVQDYSILNLGTKNMEALIFIELWMSAMGAKGVLHQAWSS